MGLIIQQSMLNLGIKVEQAIDREADYGWHRTFVRIGPALG